MILLCVFFFPPETIRKLFFRKKKKVYPIQTKLSSSWLYLFLAYFTLQLALPLRHHLYHGPPSWTEEGHRLAWRMMLRSKSGYVRFEVEDKETGVREKINLKDYLIPNQISSLKGQPDMIWQFAQYLKKAKAREGKHVAVYVNSNISLNGHPRRALIQTDVDLASTPWEPFKHSQWILTYE